MFVHLGMDIEKQWEKAVNSLMHMSNLEIALVWRKLSSFAPLSDYRVHSEYKCLFKRAVREAESRGYGGCAVHTARGVVDGDLSDDCVVVEEEELFDGINSGHPGGLRNGWDKPPPGEGIIPFTLDEEKQVLDLSLFTPLDGLTPRSVTPRPASRIVPRSRSYGDIYRKPRPQINPPQ